MGHNRSIIIGLALLLGQTAGAAAADLGLPPPPPAEAPCIGCTGPIYLKGFVGAANPHVDSIDSELFAFNNFQVFHHDIKNSALWGLGFGYEFNSWLRFDITGEYRGRSAFFAQDRFPGGNGTFSVASNSADGTFLPGTNEYTADFESWVGLANAYIDLGTYYCVTPYIGGGVGFASLSVLGLKDVNVVSNSVFFAADHTETNFAWAAYAGLAYDVTPSVTLDLSYRYTDLGDARSGTVTAYDNSSSYRSLDIDDINSHDLMLAVRWKLGHQPVAPMPVAFK
jgi:opacity protein-like surface antigen